MYITAKNIKSDGILLKDITYVSKEVHDEIYTRCNPEKGDILYIKDGATTGIATINSLSEPFSMLSSVALLKPIKHLNNYYLLDFLQSPLCYNFTRNNMKGVGITRVTLTQMERWLIPIAPLKEQKCIVEQVDDLFSAVIDINRNKEELFDYIKNAKSKILDLAVRGKLVPQDPNDEPASVLLERIKAERPEGKKKAKSTSDNSHYENLPFEIPQSWAWCQLDDILDYEQPTEYIVQTTNYSDLYQTPVLTAGKSFLIGHTDEKQGIFKNIPVIIFDDFTTESKYVDFEFKVKSSAMKMLKANNNVNLRYVFYYMSITKLLGDSHKRYWISEYSKLYIPIPPYEEQERIVHQVKNIFSNLDVIVNEL
jgi:type I restriction enzyme S subunit